jgi:ribosomal subunit interface protein
MQLDITFRNLRARDSIRQRAEALYQKLERFLDPSAEGQLVLTVEHSMAIVELVVASHGQTYKVAEEDPELRTAMDRMFHVMESKLRRSKERRQEHRGRRNRDEDSEEHREVL